MVAKSLALSDINLELFKFTAFADTARSRSGWFFSPRRSVGVVNTFAGNDTVAGTGIGIYSSGIYNDGTITTGAGNDIITGKAVNVTLNTTGIHNRETINTGTGNDIISGKGNSDGIDNSGTIITGRGNDIIAGNCHDYGNTGISNSGTINTGAGNDIIRVSSRSLWSIYNVGTINTGTGNDIVDGLKDGFGGDGKTYLSDGDDTLKGFGEGQFYGGTGTDKILFGVGTYTVSGSTIISSQFDTMSVSQFEKIGGANGGLFIFSNGTLTVDSAGIGTFA